MVDEHLAHWQLEGIFAPGTVAFARRSLISVHRARKYPSMRAMRPPIAALQLRNAKVDDRISAQYARTRARGRSPGAGANSAPSY